MFKTYRRAGDGTLHYLEAWTEEEPAKVVRHWGRVGHQGETADMPAASPAAAAGLLAQLEAGAAADGYAPIPEAAQHWAVVQYPLTHPEGSAKDRSLQARVEHLLTEHLAWRGLGTVEGATAKDYRLNIFTLVVDPARAVPAIRTCLREGKANFAKVRIGVAPFASPDAVKLKYSNQPLKEFTL